MGEIDLIFERLTDKKFRKYALVIDVGGTVTNIGVAGLDKKPVLVYKSQLWTKHIGSILKLTKDSLKFIKDNLKIDIKEASIAVASRVDKKTMSTNHPEKIRQVKLSELKKIRGLKQVILLNDFEALGYGINILTKKDYKTIRKGDPLKEHPIGIIGPGTGLGTVFLTYDSEKKAYIPYASQQSNADFPVRNKQEFEMLEWINKKIPVKKYEQEEFVSGRGIEKIYAFLRHNKKYKKTNYSKEIDDSKDKAFLIEKYRKKDRCCKETFEFFSKFCGRVTRNFIVTHLPYAGIYIAGGVLIRNPDLLGKTFFSELLDANTKQKLIKGIPVRIITHKELSLMGAAYALTI